MRKWYRDDPRLSGKADRLLHDIYAVFGWKTRIVAPLLGRFAWLMLKREEARLAAGWTYEPRSFLEKNEAAIALEKAHHARLKKEKAYKIAVAGEPVATFGK
jgi:hypothetical protein